MAKEVTTSLIKIVPQSILLILIVGIAVTHQERIEGMLDKITKFEAMGVSVEINQKLVPDKFKDSVRGFKLTEDLQRRLGEQRKRMESARILITKDKRDSAQWLADVFRQLGADVDIAICGDEAKELVHRHEYSLLISDIAWDECSAGYKNAVEFYNSEPDLLPGRRILFYISNPWSPRQVPDYSLDVTTDLVELIHLTLDILERGRDA